MLVIATIGVPVVLTYTTVIYWSFRGKVRLGAHSY
jgi:cytochrome d ubiquinol oxidase subunit II